MVGVFIMLKIELDIFKGFGRSWSADYFDVRQRIKTISDDIPEATHDQVCTIADILREIKSSEGHYRKLETFPPVQDVSGWMYTVWDIDSWRRAIKKQFPSVTSDFVLCAIYAYIDNVFLR